MKIKLKIFVSVFFCVILRDEVYVVILKVVIYNRLRFSKKKSTWKKNKQCNNWINFCLTQLGIKQIFFLIVIVICVELCENVDHEHVKLIYIKKLK